MLRVYGDFHPKLRSLLELHHFWLIEEFLVLKGELID